MTKLVQLKRYALTPVVDLINHSSGVQSDVSYNYFYGYFAVTTQARCCGPCCRLCVRAAYPCDERFSVELHLVGSLGHGEEVCVVAQRCTKTKWFGAQLKSTKLFRRWKKNRVTCRSFFVYNA